MKRIFRIALLLGKCYNPCVMKEGIFYIETLSPYVSRRYKIDKLYFKGKTKFQVVHCFYNNFLGKVLFLDHKIQSAEIDEFIYHEALVHPPLITHPHPKKVIILGGGEGATLREVLRHQSVQQAIMVDIDEDLVKICQKYLPEWSAGAFSDPRSKLIFTDARQYLEANEEKFDVIISDLTEPVCEGLSIYLFTREFFELLKRRLNPEGVLVLQAGSADEKYSQFMSSLVKTLENVFPVVRPYWSFILSFSLPWGFILASMNPDPLSLSEVDIRHRLESRQVRSLKFYHPGIHRGLFALPLYLLENFKQGRLLTDDNPFIWKL